MYPLQIYICVSSDTDPKASSVVLNAYLSLQASGQVVSFKADNRFQSHTQFIQTPLPFGMVTVAASIQVIRKNYGK
jgi:hypothetical protein